MTCESNVEVLCLCVFTLIFLFCLIPNANDLSKLSSDSLTHFFYKRTTRRNLSGTTRSLTLIATLTDGRMQEASPSSPSPGRAPMSEWQCHNLTRQPHTVWCVCAHAESRNHMLRGVCVCVCVCVCVFVCDRAEFHCEGGCTRAYRGISEPLLTRKYEPH